ncbi:MAG: AAA family ATPase, partial [Spirochaetales bacterium]
MKPLKLSLKNIGPFVGNHTIDFTALDNIFLISGKTGGGKTTILDAVTYALYGSLAGARKTNDKRHLRSDFCNPQDECTIELDFLLNGNTYRVERSLPVMYTTRNGTQREEGEIAILYQAKTAQPDTSLMPNLFESETGFEQITSQKSETDTALKSLLSLSVDEFSRIVLLPQGEFATFLRQNSTERKAMLAKLFPIDQFSRITESLKESRIQKLALLGEITGNLNHITQIYDPKTAEETEKELVAVRDKANNDAAMHQKSMYDLRNELEKLSEQAAKFKEFQIIAAQRKALAEQKDETDADIVRLEKCLEAEKIYPLAKTYQTAQNQLRNIYAEQEICVKEIEECQKQTEIINAQSDNCETDKQRLGDIELSLHDLERCRVIEEKAKSAQKEYDILQSQHSACLAEMQDIQSELQPLSDFTANLEKNQTEYENAAENYNILSLQLLFAKDAVAEQKEILQNQILADANHILNDFIQADKKAKSLDLASALAHDLENGEPCPVCGSTEHPRTAQKSEDFFTYDEKIEAQEKIVRQAAEILEQTRGYRRELAGEIRYSSQGLATTTNNSPPVSCLENAEKNKDKAKTALKTAENIVNEKKSLLDAVSAAVRQKENLEAKQIPLREKETDLNLSIARIKTSVEQSQDELNTVLQKVGEPEKNINAAINILTCEKHSLMQKTEDFESKKKQNDEKRVRLAEKILATEKNLKNTELQVLKSCEDVTELLLTSSFCDDLRASSANKIALNEDELFESIQRVQDALLGESQKLALQKKIEQYKNEMLRLETLYNEKKSDVPQTGEQTQERQKILQEQHAQTEILLEEAHSAYTSAQANIMQFEEQKNKFNDYTVRKDEITAELNLYTRLYNAISGGNPKKIPLDSWVLGMYLEEITLFASKRLERISDGRYTMYSNPEQDGG